MPDEKDKKTKKEKPVSVIREQGGGTQPEKVAKKCRVCTMYGIETIVYVLETQPALCSKHIP